MNSIQFFEYKRLDENATFSATQVKLFAEEYLREHLRQEYMELCRKTLDVTKITNIEIDGIDNSDFPDFCDAYISSCYYDGEPATDDMLEVINEDSGWVHQQVFEYLT
jgi:uncharacterized protein YnzC (UPF0291/DUF896 family)